MMGVSVAMKEELRGKGRKGIERGMVTMPTCRKDICV